jgi:hypothetical protein
VIDKAQLRCDLERIAAVLSPDDRFRHVRRIVVWGWMLGDESEEEVRGHQLRLADRRASNEHRDLRRDVDSDSDGGAESDSEEVSFSPDQPYVTEERKKIQHTAWLPFARFLDRLPGLTDLVYGCTDQVPASVLVALRNHPRARLHVRSFSLRSLYQERDQPQDIDPDELALATSPNLYSIQAACQPHDVTGRLSFSLDAVQSMVLGAAPNLRRVHVSISTPLLIRPDTQSLRPAWRGFPDPGSNQANDDTTRPRLARLETLAFSGYCRTDLREDLYGFMNSTDFRYLVRLRISCGISRHALNTVASMADKGDFSSLQSLALFVVAHDYRENKPDTLDKPTSLFLEALPPLKSLYLTGYVSNLCAHAVLHRHGPTLRKLRFLPFMQFLKTTSSATMRNNSTSPWYMTLTQDIALRCPRVEFLSLRIQRHQGGPEEVALYRALGTLPRLARLTLFLDCSLPEDDALVFGPAVAQRAGERLASCAVDAVLARAIFAEISRDGAPLRYLLIVAEPPSVKWLNFAHLTRWVARTWVCSRPRGEGELVVREDREHTSMETRGGYQVYRGRLEEVLDECRNIWNTLWPPRGGDWRDEWHSFPLDVQGPV